MAELIPTLNTCLSKMTSGEKRFAQRLESLLEVIMFAGMTFL